MDRAQRREHRHALQPIDVATGWSECRLMALTKHMLAQANLETQRLQLALQMAEEARNLYERLGMARHVVVKHNGGFYSFPALDRRALHKRLCGLFILRHIVIRRRLNVALVKVKEFIDLLFHAVLQKRHGVCYISKEACSTFIVIFVRYGSLGKPG
ncbi:MAG: hypothetical protein M3Y76_01890 [Chloroflexota bacterium]|nr:hypothetical protein [Chloroflexota bacterium]